MIQNSMIIKQGSTTGDVVTYQKKYFDSIAKDSVYEHIESLLDNSLTDSPSSFLGYMDSFLPQLIMCTSRPVIYSTISDNSYGKDIANGMRNTLEFDKNKIGSYFFEIFSIAEIASDLDTLTQSDKNYIINNWRKIFSILGMTTYTNSQEFIVKIPAGFEAMHIIVL